jgi:hypothetical protein
VCALVWYVAVDVRSFAVVIVLMLAPAGCAPGPRVAPAPAADVAVAANTAVAPPPSTPRPPRGMIFCRDGAPCLQGKCGGVPPRLHGCGGPPRAFHCRTDAECRTEARCRFTQAPCDQICEVNECEGRCVPGCGPTTVCPAGERCELDGHCRAIPCREVGCAAYEDCAPGAADAHANGCLGRACASDATCGDGLCINGRCAATLATCYPGPCRAHADCGTSWRGGNEACSLPENDVYFEQTTQHLCGTGLYPTLPNQGCRPELRCGPRFTDVGWSMQCAPPCTAKSCAPNATCDADGVCRPISCVAGWKCPANWRCDPAAAAVELGPAALARHGCVRIACRADAECAGACVLGHCYASAGRCPGPPPVAP